MSLRKNIVAAAVAGLYFVSCSAPGTPGTGTAPRAGQTEATASKSMNSYLHMFEIPATDLSRAVVFYQNVFGFSIEKMEIPGMQMGVFPYEGQLITGLIVQGEGYRPSPDGVTIYMNGGVDLQPVLDKVAKHGGRVLVPKTAHADGNGFFALFLDSEGNKIGVNSPE